MPFPERLAAAASTLLGVILAVTPVLLWVAWSDTVLFIVVAVAIVSAGLLVSLEERLHRTSEGPGASVGYARLPDRFVDEIHQIFPLTYHHSMRPRARFRRAMEKLSRLTSASRSGPMP